MFKLFRRRKKYLYHYCTCHQRRPGEFIYNDGMVVRDHPIASSSDFISVRQKIADHIGVSEKDVVIESLTRLN